MLVADREGVRPGPLRRVAGSSKHLAAFEPRWSRGAAYLCIVLLSAACGSETGSSVPEHMARASALAAEGNFSSAIIELKNALSIEPSHESARWQLAMLYLDTEQGNAAEQEIDRARELGHDKLESDVARIRALLLQARYEGALTRLDELDPSPPEAMRLRGEALLGLRQYQEAEAAFKTAVAENPENTGAIRGLALIAAGYRRFDEAQEQVERALAVSRKETATWLLKGDLEMIRGDADAALASFRTAYELDSKNPNVRAALARAELGRGEIESARTHVSAILKSYPKSAVGHYLRAAIAWREGELDAALAAVREVLRAVPSHGPGLLLLAGVHLARDELNTAAEALGKLLQVAPGHVAARKSLARLELRQRRPGRAIEVLRPARRLAPDDWEVASLLGTAFVADGQPDEGTEELERAAKLDPEGQSRTRLAAAYITSDRPEQGIAELEAVLTERPSDLQAGLVLAMTYLGRGDADGALRVAEPLATAYPDNGVFLNLTAAALEAQGETARARATYEAAIARNPAYTKPALNLARLDLVSGDEASARARYARIAEDPRVAVSDQVVATLHLAQLDLRAGNAAAAKRQFDIVLAKHANDPVALGGLAEIAIGEGRRSEARTLLGQARDSNPTSVEPRIGLARLALDEGDRTAARAAIDEALVLAPNDISVRLLQTQLLVTSGSTEAAIPILESLVADAPRSPDAWLQLGLARVRTGDNGAGRAAFAKVLELQPDHPLGLAALGSMSLAAGDTAAALEIARRLRAAHPDAPNGYVLEGDAYLADDPRAAARAYSAAAALAPSGQLVVKLVSAKWRSEDRPGAYASANSWLSEHPQDTGVRFALAGMFVADGDTTSAIREYERLHESAPDNAIYLNNLAWHYWGIRDPRAIPYAERAYALAPNNPDVADTRAWLHIEQGELERGLQMLRTLVQSYPAAPWYRYHLAVGLARAGEIRAARTELESVVAGTKLEPVHSQARELLARLR